MVADDGRGLITRAADRQLTAPGWADVADLAEHLVAAWGSWAPTLTADGQRVAFLSDRFGLPQLFVQDSDGAEPVLLRISDDPVLSVHWSPDGQWLGCSVATGGGVRTEVWVIRPDGSEAQRVAGGPGQPNAKLGPWSRQGHGLVVTVSSDQLHEPNECLLIDPQSGRRVSVAVGALVDVLDITADARFALLRDGTRGAQFCRLLDRQADADFPVLPYEHTGSTDYGLLRPAPRTGSSTDPDARASRFVAYLVTDAGRPRRELVDIGIQDDGHRIAAGTLAARDDAELEFADADASGTWLVLVWNVAGVSEVEVLDTRTGARRKCPDVPGSVISHVAMARDGATVVVAVEGPTSPRALWRLDVATRSWTPVTRPAPTPPMLLPLVGPELVRFTSHDGLQITGWLYRACPADGAPGPAMLSLHGGPEAQERPLFSPQHQVMAAVGITVFAPNIRGSSGFGRAFVHADDRYGRTDAIGDVNECARVLVERGWADPGRIAVTGRSYGGYATLMALVRHRGTFAAGVDICGMSDLMTFYRDTEPWIGAAAVTKYGDPVHDAELLRELSPLHQASRIDVPLLVVHGELDTNVPRNEALQIVARLRDLGRPVDYLELAGEGHEYRRAGSKLRLLQELTTFLTRML